MQLPVKTFLMVVRIMVITIISSIGAMGVASVSASYVRNTLNTQSVPQLAVVHQSSSWLNSSVKPLPAVPTLVSISNLAGPAHKNASFSGLPLKSIGGTQPQITGTPEPAEVDMTETAELTEVDDNTQEEQVTRTPVVEFDEETHSSTNEDQDEHMSGTPSPEQDDEMSNSNSSNNEDSQQQNHQAHGHSNRHNGNHGGEGGGD